LFEVLRKTAFKPISLQDLWLNIAMFWLHRFMSILLPILATFKTKLPSSTTNCLVWVLDLAFTPMADFSTSSMPTEASTDKKSSFLIPSYILVLKPVFNLNYELQITNYEDFILTTDSLVV